MNKFTFPVTQCEVPPTRYHHYEELVEALKDINEKWPKLTRLYTLSEKTLSGRDLWVIQISIDANKERSDLKPMVKYVANMHGNEPVGREMMIALPEYLLKTYESGEDEDITNLIDNTDIHIMPTMNHRHHTDRDSKKIVCCKCNQSQKPLNPKVLFSVLRFVWFF